MLYNGRKVSNSFETIRFLEFNRSMMLLAYDFLRAGNLILKEEILLSHFRSSSSSIFRMRSMASSASSRGIVAIVGVGPKLGRCIARKFAHEGYTVAILARDLGTPPLSLLPSLSRFADEIAREEKAQVFAIRIDCSDSRSVREAFEGVLSLGFVEVLVYNAYQPVPWHPTSFTDIHIDSFQKSLAVSSIGAFLCAQQVIPGMVDRRKGTILFTGCSASLNGIAGYSELCCGKFALRALSQSLAREFQPLGVHVAHVIIDGVVGPPRVAKIVSWGAPERRRGRVYGPRCGGSNLLALAHSGPGRLDPGDRPSSLPPQALLVLLPLYSFHLLCLSLHYFILPPRAPPPPLPLFPIFSPKVQAALSLKLISNVC
ncbi:unnamed protein product, partial [Vitis vinifera]